MRVLRLLPAAIAIFALIDVGAAQYARPTFDDDDDFGYVPPATAVTQKPALQPAQPQAQPDLVDIKVRPEQAPPRRVTIRRRKKPTPPPETQVVSTPPREERLEILPQAPINAPSRVPLSPVSVISGPIPSVNAQDQGPLAPAPVTQVPFAPAAVTQPPGNFMFMRIGGYGFDNGEVPNGIEPPKQMLPELVPAGVRVRTPSGVVVSVRGQPGLYGIHPTPPPDASHGPRKPAPKPEIVYLTQKSTPAPRPVKTIPVAQVATVPNVPSVPYTENNRVERLPAQIRITPPEPNQRIDIPQRSPGQYVQTPQPLPIPQIRVTAQAPIAPPSQPILRQTAPRAPPRVVIENSYPRNQPETIAIQGVRIIQAPNPQPPSRPILRQTVPPAPPRFVVGDAYSRNQPGNIAFQEGPILQVPYAGQFGQRLRPLTQENLVPVRINEIAPPGVAQPVPPRGPPRRLRPQNERQRIPQEITDVPRERPGSIQLSGPNADLGLTRIVEPQFVIQENGRPLQPAVYQGAAPVSQNVFTQVPARGAEEEPIDIKQPNLVRITGFNPPSPIRGAERSPVGPATQLTTVPVTPITGVQTLVEAPPRTQNPQVILVQQSPVETLVGTPISGIPVQYGSPEPQQPRIVFQQPAVVPNLDIQRITSPPSVIVQQNDVPKRQRVPVRPPSSIPPTVNQQVPLRPGNDQQIILGPNIPARTNVPQRNIRPTAPGVPQDNLGISLGSPGVRTDQQNIIGPNVPTRANFPQRNVQTVISGAPEDNNGIAPGSPEFGREAQRPLTPAIQKTIATSPLTDENQTKPENPAGFSFMRIGGFGFDNGVVPARFNVEPAREMLPELVPAGVRVRTPSGVVVSVRGRPGLYGIHPTPAPDTSYGPTKKPPRPEIVYLDQKTPRPTPAPTASPSPVVQIAPLRYERPNVDQRPVRIPAAPLNVIEQPRRVSEQPLRIVEQPIQVPVVPQRVVTQVPQRVVTQVPQRVVTQVPQRVVTQVPQTVLQPVQLSVEPQRVVTQVPQRVVTQVPQRVVEQVPQRVVIQVPQRVVTQVPQTVPQPVQLSVEPQRVVTQVPQRVVEQVPQRVVIQVPQRVVTQVPQRVITQVPQTGLQPVQLPPTPLRLVPQAPRPVTQIPRRDFVVAQSPQAPISPIRSQAAQVPLPVRPSVELQRINTPSTATKAPATSTGSGSYGNDLSDFEDFEPAQDAKQQPLTASRETRVSSGSANGEPRVVARDVSQSENPYGVNLSSNGAEGPVKVVIGNIEEGPYNFHHRHTHENGFAFVKLGVPFYQKMEADVAAVAGPPVYARPAFQEDGSGVVVKKSRRKSS